MAATVFAALHEMLGHMVVNEIDTLGFDKETLPEVEIGGEMFCIAAVRKDIGVHNVDSAAMTHNYASRFHIDCFPKPLATHDSDLHVRTTAAHVFMTGYRVTAGSSHLIVPDDMSVEVIVDKDSLLLLHEAAVLPRCRPEYARDISHMSDHMEAEDALKLRYEAYIHAINGRNMTQTLPAFCQNVVVHNGKSLHLFEYQRLMEDAQAVMPDLEFSIASSLVDLDRRILAAKLDFRGTPLGEFGGVTPAEGMGKEVKFSEMVFYWFQDGKIAQVVSLVDLTGYRKQVTGQN